MIKNFIIDCSVIIGWCIKEEILSLARNYNLTAYDASYLSLAIKQELPLATKDKSLIKAAHKSGVKIFLGK